MRMHMNIYQTQHDSLERREHGFSSETWRGASLGEITLRERVREMVTMDMIRVRRSWRRELCEKLSPSKGWLLQVFRGWQKVCHHVIQSGLVSLPRSQVQSRIINLSCSSVVGGGGWLGLFLALLCVPIFTAGVCQLHQVWPDFQERQLGLE